MYPVNSCSPIRLKIEAPIAQLLGLKEYKRRVAKNNYVHYWFSRLVHIFLAMQCKEDFFKMAFFNAVRTTKDGEKTQQKSKLITPTESIYQRAGKLSAGANTVSIQAISQRESWLNMEQATRVWESSTSEVCQEKKNVYIVLLRLPETSNPKIQTGNTPRLFFFCMLPMCGTPHIQRMQSSMQPCLSIADKWLENWKTHVPKGSFFHQCVKQAPVWSVSRKTGFLRNGPPNGRWSILILWRSISTSADKHLWF